MTVIKPSKDMMEWLADITGVVEANSYEKMCLWQEYHQERKEPWVDDMSGYAPTIGHLGRMPVCLSMFRGTVKGKKILFIDAVSQVVDHRIVDEWLEMALPDGAKRTNGSNTYVNKVNAMNFHNVFRE